LSYNKKTPIPSIETSKRDFVPLISENFNLIWSYREIWSFGKLLLYISVYWKLISFFYFIIGG